MALPCELSTKRAVAAFENESGELVNLRWALYVKISPQEPMERPVFGFKNQLMVHLTDITNQHFQLFSKSYQDVEYVAL